MKAKKVLLYGNCQLSPLGMALKKSANFEVLKCKDYGLEPFWIDDSLFAVWSPENSGKQKKYLKRIVEAVSSADIFIFQHYKDLSIKGRPVELSTQYLHDVVAKGVKICLPNFHLDSYLNGTDSNLIIQWLSQQNLDENEILHFLANRSHPNIKKLIEYFHTESINNLEIREKSIAEMYDVYISCVDFIQSNYKLELLSVTQNHPTFNYFHYISKKLHYLLGEPISIMDISIPDAGIQVNPSEFHYFKTNFPQITICNKVSSLYSKKLNIGYVQEQLNGAFAGLPEHLPRSFDILNS